MCEIGKGNSWDDKKNKEEEGDKVEKEIVKKESVVSSVLGHKIGVPDWRRKTLFS